MTAVCPICASQQAVPVYSALSQPALLNHLLNSREVAMSAATADLRFVGCRDCGFVWNASFNDAAIRYETGYVNDQSQSPTFSHHLENVAQRLARLAADVPGDILEIGCGQGGFLRSLCDSTGRRGIGFDPACAGAPRPRDRVQLRAEPFTAESTREIAAERRIAMIYCRHVLEHLPDPLEMVRTMMLLIAGNPGALLYVEVPCFDWIWHQAAFFDFFHEHCSLFNASSLHRMLAEAGLANIRIASVFGNQYLAAEATGSAERARTPPRNVADDHFSSIARSLTEERQRWTDRIRYLLSEPPVFIWGAGAKGVSLVNQLNLSCADVPCLIDINPAKQGKFVPVTGQQVIGPRELKARMNSDARPTILVMNPSYQDEIARTLDALGIHASIEAMNQRSCVEVHR